MLSHPNSKIPRRYSEPTKMYHHRVPQSIYQDVLKRANSFIDSLIDGSGADTTSATEQVWKQGFVELYTFFREVMQNVDHIVTREEAQDIWNNLLGKRDKALISKLGKEVKPNV